MNVFRRPRATGLDDEVQTCGGPQALTPPEVGWRQRQDAGPLLVAVDGYSWDALEWAAAEAAARESALRIVHAVNWPPLAWNMYCVAYQWDAIAQERAECIVEQAAARARRVAPELRVTTHLQVGPAAAGVLREASRDDALIVLSALGQRRKTGRRVGSVSRRVAGHAPCPVAVVELLDDAPRGPSSGRVVVGADLGAGGAAALDFAFRAAQRRGAGLTAVHAWTPWDPGDDLPATSWVNRRAVEDALRACRVAFPDVDVQERFVAGPVGSALVAESAGAALVVLGAGATGRLRGPSLDPVARAVLRSARGPVVFVKTPSTHRAARAAGAGIPR